MRRTALVTYKSVCPPLPQLVPTVPFTVCERTHSIQQATLQTVQQNYTTRRLIELIYGKLYLSQSDPDDLSWDSLEFYCTLNKILKPSFISR